MSSEGQTKTPHTASTQLIPEQRHKLARDLVNSIQHAKPMDPDFDALHATVEELQAHGIPPRPCAAAPQEQVAAWEELVRNMKSMELITPTFEIIDRELASRATTTSADRPEAKTATGFNWAGALIKQNGFIETCARWTVPKPDRGRGDRDAWYSAAYVGIDGCTSTDVLAGGTGHDYYPRLGAVTYAWFEWYPAAPIRIKNITIRSGDRVWCCVWGNKNDSTLGYFTIVNETSKYWVSFWFRTGTRLVGDSAEWIVEGDEPEANFHSVQFDDCWAMKKSDEWLNLASAATITSTCADGTVCTSQIMNNTTLKVTYG